MDFDALRFDLRGVVHSVGSYNFNSATGTLFLGGTALGQPTGELIVDNEGITTAPGGYTPLFPVLAEDVVESFSEVRVRLRGASQLALITPNLRIRDPTVDTEATLYLKRRILRASCLPNASGDFSR